MNRLGLTKGVEYVSDEDKLAGVELHNSRVREKLGTLEREEQVHSAVCDSVGPRQAWKISGVCGRGPG